MKFSQAVVKTPCKNLVNGLTEANLGQPDYELALEQHSRYIAALEACGLSVSILPPDEDYPDSTFVEDVALLTPRCAILTRPGAPSRRGETLAMQAALESFYDNIDRIQGPGTVDAGDIMMVGEHYYIGLSDRTTVEGAQEMIRLLNTYGMTGSTVPLEHVLHLKTGVAYLENNNLVVSGEFVNKAEFESFNKLTFPDTEGYAANCIWANGRVILPAGHPQSAALVSEAGYPVIEVDMSEFQKLDGGVSCLSLRF